MLTKTRVWKKPSADSANAPKTISWKRSLLPICRIINSAQKNPAQQQFSLDRAVSKSAARRASRRDTDWSDRDGRAPRLQLSRSFMKPFRCLSLFLMLSVVSTFAAADVMVPSSLEKGTLLASNGRAAMPLVIGEKASASIKATAAELARYLGRMSGAEFVVETGDGSRGLVVGRAADFAKLSFTVEFGAGPFGREDYVLRSQPKALYLVGASDLAVSHAAWDLLHRLGYRQFFPGETWEIVPKIRELSIAVDARESPSFYARRIWYNWGTWGYNDEPYRQWCVRNRAVQGFKLNSGHAYESIIAANRAEFEKHPEYLAQIGGERKLRGDVKFCIANAELRKLVAGWAVAQVKANPQIDSVSMDPSDGGGWCECAECARLGSVSDRVITLANEVATAIHAPGLGPKYVGLYAYNLHCAPPTIRASISATRCGLEAAPPRGRFQSQSTTLR